MLMPVLIKQTLANSLAIRELSAVTYQVWVIPSSMKAVASSKLAIVNYMALSKDDRLKAGPPHLHVWEGFIQGLLEDVQAKGADPATPMITELLKKYETEWNNLPLEHALEAVEHFRVAKSFRSDRKKLMYKVAAKESGLLCFTA